MINNIYGNHRGYDITVPRHTTIYFDGIMENIFCNMIPQNGDQYLLTVILYEFFVFFQRNGKNCFESLVLLNV